MKIVLVLGAAAAALSGCVGMTAGAVYDGVNAAAGDIAHDAACFDVLIARTEAEEIAARHEVALLGIICVDNEGNPI